MQCPDCGTIYSKKQAFCLACGQILSDGNEPARIGHYRLLEKIGQGGMGMVYRGFDEELERDVAIKVLHRKLLGDLKQIERFRREARNHSQFQHNNIVTLLDVIDSETIMALVMELVKGCTLKDFIHERGVPSWGEVIAISEAVMAGLGAAHAHDVVHRDMKLSNVFLSDDGSIKLMDFGLAKSKKPGEDITESGAAVGTYFYMAPEQIIGREIDGRADLYAFGVMLYRICTGQLPFTSTGGGEFELMEKHVRHTPARPETLNADIPLPLSDLIMDLLEKSPDDRPANCEVVIERLRGIAQPEAPHLDSMSFSQLHEKLNVGARRLSDTSVATSTSGSTGTAAEEAPEHSMLWAFRHSPEAPEEPPLDLRSPPPIERATLQKLKKSIESIPPLPEIWYRIERILDDPESAPSDLASEIDKDPVLTAHILRLANSAAYAMPGKHVTNVAIGIARVGMGNIHDFLLQKLMPDFARLERSGADGTIDMAIETQQLWYHSQIISMLSRSLCEYSSIVSAKAASVFGMLHDIGKFVILHTEDDETLQSLRVAISAGSPSLRAEWDILGYTHIDAGMMLALHWRLPRTIHRFIYFHHHPEWHSADVWPVDMQPAIMMNHMAHLLVHDFEKERSEEHPLPDTIWSPATRSHIAATEGILRQPLRLPLKDVASYQRLQHELTKIDAAYEVIFSEAK